MAQIHELISTISREAGALAPERKDGVPFPFRGIDGTVAHLASHLQEHGVIVVPEVLEHKVSSAPSGTKVVTTSEILTKFTFYAPDGSSVSAVTAGLANDYADRSTAQAQSVAFRVALLQTFTLPTQTLEPEQTGVERESVPTTAAPQSDPNVPTIFSVRGEISTLLNASDSGKIREAGAAFFKGKGHESDWPDSLDALMEWRDALRAKK